MTEEWISFEPEVAGKDPLKSRVAKAKYRVKGDTVEILWWFEDAELFIKTLPIEAEK